MSWPERLSIKALAPFLISRLQGGTGSRMKERLIGVLHDVWSGGAETALISLHGIPFRINSGNPYPLLVHSLPSFNAPLVELVAQVHSALSRPVVVVDAGAACGDTPALLNERCPGAVKRCLSIEGDPFFYRILCENARNLRNVVPIQAMLSSTADPIGALVRTHPGTASAKGEAKVPPTTLDCLLSEQPEPADVLKVDVDGFDGRVLAGARGLLRRWRPAVIFEWHPVLYMNCGNDPLEPFVVLHELGYHRLLWFCNTGTFSHFGDALGAEGIARTAQYLIAVNARADAHYDIVALPDGHPADDLRLAMLSQALP